jgi:hypothetical protein
MKNSCYTDPECTSRCTTVNSALRPTKNGIVLFNNFLKNTVAIAHRCEFSNSYKVAYRAIILLMPNKPNKYQLQCRYHRV